MYALAFVFPLCHIVLFATAMTLGACLTAWGIPKNRRQWMIVGVAIMAASIAGGWTWWNAFGMYINRIPL